MLDGLAEDALAAVSALAVGCGSGVLSLLLRCLAPGLHRAHRGMNPCQALRLKRFATVTVLEKLSLSCIASAWVRDCTLIGLATILLSSCIQGALRGEVWILVLGHIIALYYLLACRSLGSPERGPCARVLAQRRLFRALVAFAHDSAIDVHFGELKQQLHAFLHHPVESDVMVVSLPFLTLLAGLIECDVHDCLRVRYFVVEGCYARYRGDPHTGGLYRREDCLVDLHAGSVCVLSEEQPAPDSKWIQEGQRLPWHLALEPAAVARAEIDARSFGWDFGYGCLSTRNLASAWASNEAQRDVDRCLRVVEDARREVDRRTAACVHLCGLTTDVLGDDQVTDMVRALVQAGIDVNSEAFELDGMTALKCCWGNNRVETGKLLIDAKADVSADTGLGRRLAVYAGVGQPTSVALRDYARARGLLEPQPASMPSSLRGGPRIHHDQMHQDLLNSRSAERAERSMSDCGASFHL